MQSKSKKLLSFISAIVMLVTLLPSALFVNAAEAVDLLNGVPYEHYGSWASKDITYNVPESGEYKVTAYIQGSSGAHIKIWVGSNLLVDNSSYFSSDTWTDVTETKTYTLPKGDLVVSLQGQNFKYTKFTIEKIGGSTGGDESSSNVESSSTTEPAVADGFHVSGKKILDANDNEFIMRGINIGHAWLHPTHNTKPYSNDTFKAIKASARLGVNTIRFCLSDGDDRQDMKYEDWIKTPRSEVEEIIKTCEDNNVVAVFTIQDPTGNSGTWMIDNAVKYWIEIADLLNAHKDTVILNIANEWNGDMGYYRTAIQNLRNAGIGNMIMVDAGDWGHGVSTITSNAGSIAGADKLNNTIFSIHAYKDIGNVRDAVYNCNQISQPIVVGEFGDDPNSTMDCCEEWGIGYLAWSWIGNDGGAEYLDIAKDDDALELHSYGSNIFNKNTGIQSTSKLCSVYTKNNPSYTVTPKTSNSESGTVSSAQTVNIGDFVTVTATPKDGSAFKNWTINGKAVSNSASYKFRPSANTEIVANFKDAGSTKTLTLSSDTSMSYSDLGTNYVVPFIVNAGHGDIKVKITNGAGEWTNIFTDQSSISVSPSNGTEGKGTAGYNKKAPNFDTSIYSYCQNNSEYTINSNSPAGIYYVGVSGSENITIEITYEDGDVSKYGSEDPDEPTDPHYIVTLQSSNTNNGTINGETFSKKNFMPSEALTFPTATANSGYTFKGYNDGENNLYQPGEVYSFAEGLTENEKITFTAVFEKNVGTYRDLPIISVTTKDDYVETVDKEKSVDAWISTYNTDLIDMNLAGIIANGGELRGRGNSTWNLAKQPYRLKFGKKTSLLTNTDDKEKKWVLLADYADRTLLRNKTAFDLASKLDNIPFASKTQSVELYINGEYRGVYLVAQQTEDKDKRAGIGAVADDDPYDANFTATDDELKFLAELDAGGNSEPLHCYAHKTGTKDKYYTIKSGAATNPNVSGDQDESNNVYVERIKQYLDDVDSAISSSDETRIRQYIDVPSFVDMYILQEYAENADVGSASFYLSKYSDEIHGNKLFASPPWDFDRCFGNDTRGVNYNNLYVAKGETDDSDKTNVSKWFTALCSQSWFVKEIEKRFTQLEDDGAFNDLTNANTYEYWKTSEAFNANFEKWQVQGNSTGLGYGEVGAKGDLNKEINYLVDWIQNRFQKMHDTYYKADMKENYTVAVKSSDETMGTVAKNYLGNNRYTVTATPKSGYKFTGWTSTTTLSSGDAVYTFTSTSDVTLTAHFEAKGIELPVYGDTLRLEAESAKIFSKDVFTVQSDNDDNFGLAISPSDNPQWLKSNANKNGGKGEAYIPFTIPASAGNLTYNFSMCYANVKAGGSGRPTKLSVYKLADNGNVEIDGKKYTLVAESNDMQDNERRFSDGAIEVLNNISLQAGETYYIGLYGENWASFDFVDVKATNGNPFIVEDGCDFKFTDQFGNTLANNSAKPVEKDGQMYYSPVAPANTTAQGYYLSAWEYTTNGVTNVIKATGENDTKDKAPEYVNSELEKLAFPSGYEVTFKATYTIIGETKTLTVDGGDIYIPANKNDTEFTLKTNAQVARLKNFGEVRIQASPEQGETFQYWTLNGMIYSYDESFKYSMWSDSTFVAHYADTETTKAPIAYVGTDVEISSMSADKYMVSIFTEYYVPEGMESVEKGILYSSASGFDNLKAVQNGNSDSTLTAPNKCAKLVSRDSNVANNETFMSLSGLLKGRDIYIRPYIIYREYGQTKVVYSNYIAHVNSGDTDICEVKEVSNF